MNNRLYIFICLFIYINCYCKGTHNRIDLNKKECARYEIEKEEVNGDNVENYECCYYSSLIYDFVSRECVIESKNKKDKAITTISLMSPLNIFDVSIECSFKYLRIINIKLLFFLLLN